MAALGSVSQLVLNLQFVLLQLPKKKKNAVVERAEGKREGEEKGEVGPEKAQKEKELKAKPNEQTSIFKKFSFSTFFVTLLPLLLLFFTIVVCSDCSCCCSCCCCLCF